MLVIGDPHVEGRQPSFRRDDYPRVILQKRSIAAVIAGFSWRYLRQTAGQSELDAG
jgi:hypothetical protein